MKTTYTTKQAIELTEKEDGKWMSNLLSFFPNYKCCETCIAWFPIGGCAYGGFMPCDKWELSLSYKPNKQLYQIQIDGGKLSKEEQAELDEYAARFKKDDFEPCV